MTSRQLSPAVDEIADAIAKALVRQYEPRGIICNVGTSTAGYCCKRGAYNYLHKPADAWELDGERTCIVLKLTSYPDEKQLAKLRRILPPKLPAFYTVRQPAQ